MPNSDCVCVPFYQCHNNYIIRTKGENFINTEKLSQQRRRAKIGDFCCTKPTTDHSYCGKRKQSYLPLIDPKEVSGDATFGEFPWMVAIFAYNATTKLYKFTCGASIIQENVLMTAAHCVDKLKLDDIVIRAGEWDLSVNTEVISPQEKSVSEVIIHSDFNKDTLENDIALLVLTSPLIFTTNVAPVCLPIEGVLVES